MKVNRYSGIFFFLFYCTKGVSVSDCYKKVFSTVERSEEIWISEKACFDISTYSIIGELQKQALKTFWPSPTTSSSHWCCKKRGGKGIEKTQLNNSLKYFRKHKGISHTFCRLCILNTHLILNHIMMYFCENWQWMPP